MPFPVQYSYLIPLLPLVGAAVSGFFGAKWLKQQSHWPIWLGVGASALLSVALLVELVGRWHAGQPVTFDSHWYTWIASGDFVVEAGAWLDPLTAVMLCVVTVVGFFITVFSKGYMAGEEGYFRFFAFLGLFIFAMTCLVMGSNLVMLYLGWEGVGLCSYLLIGYYYQRPAAREAAKKAFIVNRIGDFGFSLGIMLAFTAFGTISYFGQGVGSGTGLLEKAAAGELSGFQHAAMQWLPFLLMVGAFGKSAQFPLYVWLPDAMEGPTPVSALIHAATMVTAGVYMIVRCGVLFVGNAPALWTVAAVGAFTALFAATIALRQFDLKKVFAYSTISQLGFMFVGAAVLAPVAAVFHLVTHAFFKALLFLSSGVVMHAMAGELDMRKMSGLKRVLPRTNLLMLIGCLALAGFPFFSGFFSKDEIVAAAFARSTLLGLVMLGTAFLTAYYTFRLYFSVFWGPQVLPESLGGSGHAPDHGPADAHAHASTPAVHTGGAAQSGHDAAHAADHGHHNPEPAIMIIPLVVLAIGAILAGYLNWPERHNSLGGFLGQSPSLQQAAHLYAERVGPVSETAFGQLEAEEPAAHAFAFTPLMAISALVSIAGIVLAYFLHCKDRSAGQRLVEKMRPLARVLEARYWVDEVYQNGIVEPLRRLGAICFNIDRFFIDGLVWLTGFVPQAGGAVLKLVFQRGSLQGYAAGMLFGIAIILLIIFL